MSDDRCLAGIVFAVPVEADAFQRRVSGQTETITEGLTFREGRLAAGAEPKVAWCVGGVGEEPAARAARLLIVGHRPRLMISAGFAGGLAPGIARGSLVRPAGVCGPSAAHEPMPLVGGDEQGLMLVTVDRIVRTAAEKRALAAATGAALVDMETLAVARAAHSEQLACRGLRVVSDAADDELPPDLGRLIQPQSAARRVGAVLGMLGRRPRSAVDLWQLWERAVVDGTTLAAGLVSMLAELAGDAAAEA